MKLSEFLASRTVSHVPVLFDPIMECFARTSAAPLVVDGTLGEAGHTRGFLALRPGATVIGFDRDTSMMDRARERLLGDGIAVVDHPTPGAVHMVHSPFSEIPAVLQGFGLQADFVLCDFGVAMYHFSEAARGFSFRDMALDMRLDTAQGRTARELVNQLPEEELARIFFEYGEERYGRQIARNIVRRRPVETASQLTDVILQTLIHARNRRGGRGFIRDSDADRVFQALRIAVNDELGEVERLVAALPRILSVGGVAALISFHSLEDRLVKKGFQALSREEYRILTRKPIVPDEEELQLNPAARSARLRVVERKGDDGVAHEILEETE